MFLRAPHGVPVLLSDHVSRVRRLSDPLGDEGPGRIKHRLEMAAHLARHNPAGRRCRWPLTTDETARPNPSAQTGRSRLKKRLHDSFAKIQRKRSGHAILAANPVSI